MTNLQEIEPPTDKGLKRKQDLKSGVTLLKKTKKLFEIIRPAHEIINLLHINNNIIYAG